MELGAENSHIEKLPAEATGQLNYTNNLNQAKLNFPRHTIVSGTSGAFAGILQVVLLMWLRTTMNVQYAKGGNFFSTLSKLYRIGGVSRLYRGISFALVQNPAARFGDTAANTGGLFLLSSHFPETSIFQKTLITTFFSSVWRMLLTPIELAKTVLQVHGKDGFKVLRERISISGLFSLWSGAFAVIIANWIGSYPWFVTFNFLQDTLKPALSSNGIIVRNAFIGLCCSVVSDSCSNGVRVVKTVLQTDVDLGYLSAAQKIYREGGMQAILFRGLFTRLLSNGIQSILFTVVWKICEHKLLSA
ncbi:unnamed protein product [Bathycoccus prasinos]